MRGVECDATRSMQCLHQTKERPENSAESIYTATKKVMVAKNKCKLTLNLQFINYLESNIVRINMNKGINLKKSCEIKRLRGVMLRTWHSNRSHRYRLRLNCDISLTAFDSVPHWDVCQHHPTSTCFHQSCRTSGFGSVWNSCGRGGGTSPNGSSWRGTNPTFEFKSQIKGICLSVWIAAKVL